MAGLWKLPVVFYCENNLYATEVPLANAAGNPEVADYSMAIIMFAGLGLLGLFFALMLKRQDKLHGFGVELPLNKK